MESKAVAASSDVTEVPNWKQKYKLLKRKLKGLVYEHELLSDQLERTQKKLLRISKDRSFLLDRMLRYEKVADTSSDSEATDQSDSDTEKPPPKKKMSTPPQSLGSQTAANSTSANHDDGADGSKKTPKSKSNKRQKTGSSSSKKTSSLTQEDQEKHMDSRSDKPGIEKPTSLMPPDTYSNIDSEALGSDNEADTSLVIDMK